MSAVSFVLAVADLFDGVYKAIMSVPVLSFFMSALLFFVVVSFFFWLATWGKKRKM